jgi:lysophospholipase L1-like esterase
VPIACELALHRPAIAFIQYGTNDLVLGNPDAFREELASAVDLVVAAHVIPILSTIPPRIDDEMLAARVPRYNAIIRAVAREAHVPVVDFALAMSGFVVPPLKEDGIHPSLYAYRLKNLMVLQTLAKLKRIVLENGPPDP